MGPKWPDTQPPRSRGNHSRQVHSCVLLEPRSPIQRYDTVSLRTQSVTARAEGGSLSRGPAIGAGSDGRRR